MRRLAVDRGLMGEYALTPVGRLVTGAILGAIAACVVALILLPSA